MFKLILCVAFAVAAADPQVIVSPGYSSTYLEPATTTITRQASSVINSPFYYPGFDHLIKKRAAPFVSSYWGNYWDPALLPHPQSFYTPLVSAAHLIKKRSVLAPLAPIAYTHPAFSMYSSIPALSGALPLAYDNLHFIKKRQAVWSAPINYDISSPLANSYSSLIIPNAPLWSSYAPGFPFIKK